MLPFPFTVDNPQGEGQRRSHRLSTDLCVRVRGVHSHYQPCRGNLGMTGVYIAVRDPVGSPGDVVQLDVASPTRKLEVNTLARVARVLRQDDKSRGARVIGAAFEYLPLDTAPNGVAELLRHCAQGELTSTGSLIFDDEVSAVVEGSGLEMTGLVRSVGPDWLSLTLEGRVAWGEGQDVLVQVNDGSALSGTVQSILDPELWDRGEGEPGRLFTRVRIEVSPGQRSALFRFAEHSLLTRVVERTPARRVDLSGQLRHLPLAAVVGLLQRGRLSGVLSAGDDESFFSFEIREGQVSSWVRPEGLSATDALQGALRLADGEFRFRPRCLSVADFDSVSKRLVEDVLAYESR